jgi:hypothetical protein
VTGCTTTTAAMVTTVAIPGPQGPPGAPGPPGTPGASGVSSYTHTQTSAAETWTIPHGLGFHPAGIVAKDSVGDIVEPADVIYVDNLTMRLTFPGHPMSGVADVS